MTQPKLIDGVRRIDFSKISDARGELAVLEFDRHVPFEIRRVFYMYQVPENAQRGGHALRECQQIMIAVAGTFDVIARDGRAEQRHRLDRPDQGLYLPPLVWRELASFSPTAVCLVLASKTYVESDYLRDYTSYLDVIQSQA